MHIFAEYLDPEEREDFEKYMDRLRRALHKALLWRLSFSNFYTDEAVNLQKHLNEKRIYLATLFRQHLRGGNGDAVEIMKKFKNRLNPFRAM